jgi:uncharacterized protein YfdQ (DUF2303 family)
MDTVTDNLKTVLDAGAKASALTRPGDATDVLVVPNGYQALPAEKIIEQYLPAPRRVRANVLLNHLDSFIEYVNLFKQPQSRVFTTSDGSMSAIIDYHIPSASPGLATPAWGSHRASYSPVQTAEWQRWLQSNKKRMDQTSFAEFLEENQDLIVEPKGADLLEMIQTLEGKNHIDCNSLIRLSNGQTRLEYIEQVTLKGQVNNVPGAVEFPSMLVAGIIPFDGGAAYKVRCRLRYRIENRKLAFWYEIIDPHLIIKSAVDDLIKLVQEKTGINPLFGAP